MARLCNKLQEMLATVQLHWRYPALVVNLRAIDDDDD